MFIITSTGLVDCCCIIVYTGLMHRWLVALASIQSSIFKPLVKTLSAYTIDFKVIFYSIKRRQAQLWWKTISHVQECVQGRALIFSHLHHPHASFITPDLVRSCCGWCHKFLSEARPVCPPDWWVCNLRLSRSTTCHSTPINHSDSHRSQAQSCEGENTAYIGQQEQGVHIQGLLLWQT